MVFVFGFDRPYFGTDEVFMGFEGSNPALNYP